jgi:integrase/recombinase XerC
VTWDEFFLRFSASRRLSPDTVTGYLRSWKYFLKHWPDLKGPADVTEKHLAEFYLTQLRTETVSKNTAGSRFRALLVLLGWAQRQGHLLVNPGQALRVPKPRRPIPRILSRDEVQLLLWAPLQCSRYFIRYRDRAILELLYGTGMRGGEVLALDLLDVDLYDRMLYIKKSKGRPHMMPLSVEVTQALEHYLREARPLVVLDGETAVFVSLRGSRLNGKNLSDQVRRYGQELDIPDVTPHAFRRAMATHMLENGASLPELKALLGHADIESTRFYAQVVPVEMLREHRRYHPRARRQTRKPGGPRET